MDYNNMLEDYIRYMNRHWEEELSIEELGRVHSFKGEYISYLFECCYKERLDHYVKMVKESNGETVYPEVRQWEEERIRMELRWQDDMVLLAAPLVDHEADKYAPIETAVDHYLENKEIVTLWWHDEEYSAHYMKGQIREKGTDFLEESSLIRIPANKYQVFSMEIEEDLAETMKSLIAYVYLSWIPENERKVDQQGYHYECIEGSRVCYFLALLEEEKVDPSDKIYGVETWTEYINENIYGNLTTTSLAKKFGYSPTHFKRVFRMYYQMTVSDYIRKKRMDIIINEIRNGMDYLEAAVLFGYKTYTGFSKAFKKEFHMSPAVFGKGSFEVIDLADYYENNKNILHVSIVELNPINMFGHTVFPSKGSEVDIPAQINYWLGKDFPCLHNTRFSCNREYREDKIALWYQEPETGDIEYILGPVVESFEDDIPEEMIKVTLEGGKYAIFETDKMSDENDVAETLRMYARCVFFGWVKEYRNRVDLSRITFERYVNQKIYMYVPVNY